jgi:hypothetical protein
MLLNLSHAKKVRRTKDAEQLWRARAKLLRGLRNLYQWLTPGFYEVIVSGESKQRENSKSVVRRSDFAGGGITAEERERLRQHRIPWNERAMRTTTIEPAQIVPAINRLYQFAGFANPRVVIAPSPLAAAVASAWAAAILQIAKKDAPASICHSGSDASLNGSDTEFCAMVAEDLFDGVLRATRSVIEDVSRRAIRERIDQAIDPMTEAALSFELLGLNRLEICAALRREVDAALVASAGGDMWSASPAIEIMDYPTIRNAIRAAAFEESPSLEKQISRASVVSDEALSDSEQSMDAVATRRECKDLMVASAGYFCRQQLFGQNNACHDAYFASALTDILGVCLPTSFNCLAWEQAAVSSGFEVMHSDFCIVADYPEALNVDEQYRLHCSDAPSIRWRDGWSLYHWHGVRVSKQVIEAPHSLTLAQISSEPNLEVRRVMITRFGLERFLSESGARKIGADECGVLFYLEMDGDEALAIVKVVNSTPEPDGTFKNYFLRVPPAMRTAREAVAWTFGLSAQEYEPAIQT